MNLIKVISYQRVSTDSQDYLRQIEDIKRYCDFKRYDLIKSFSEKESGKVKERSELMAMMEYLRLNPDNVLFVIISELSRLGRTSYVLQSIEQLSSLKIGLISLKENITTLNDDKTINSTSTMITSVLSSINSYELDTIAFRMRSGKINSIKNGGVVSNNNLPYGYMKVNKKLVVNEDEAITIKKIFEMSLTMGCTSIANYLNNKSIPTRLNKKWRDAVIYHMLTNTIYIGQRNYKSVKYDCQQIIDNVLFDTVQNNLKSKFNKMEINRKYDYLLNNKMIVCGVCGKPYNCNSRPLKSGKIESTYKCCSTHYKGESCGNFGVNVQRLESAVKDLLKNEYSASIANMVINTDEALNILGTLNIELKEVEGFIKKQEQTESNLIDLYTDGILKKELFNEKLTVIKKEQTKLKNQVVNIKSKIVVNQHLIDSSDWNDEDFDFDEDEHGNITETSFKSNVDKIIFNKALLKGILSKITIYPTSKRFTKRLNEVCVRCDITIFDEVTRIYISNRCKDVKIIRPTFNNARIYV